MTNPRPEKRVGKSIGNGLGAPETALYFLGLVRGEARPVWRLPGGARRGAGLAGEGSAGGASGRPVSGVDGAVRGFASFDRGAAPWPSGGEECSSCCPALLQAAWQAVSWRPVRCAGEASGAGPAARGRAAAGAARWARASCFSTCNKVVVQSRAEGLKICSARGGGHGGRWFYRTRAILGAADVSCRFSARLLVAGCAGRSWGGVGSVLARALKRGDFRPPASAF